MKRNILLIILAFACCFNSAHSQKENYNWYFGYNAGITFNPNGSPQAVTNGRLSSWEGGSAISDKFGNLKFYSNGVTVWNRNHDIMQNGTGLNGHASSTQNSLIVPFPSDTNQYYIFTTEGNERNVNGLQYSVVNMTLDGGLGGVTTKNIQLLDSVTEKVTGIQHPNCIDFWVVTYSMAANEFSSYLITETGIQPRVISPAIIHFNNYTTGFLKFSNNREKIVTAIGTHAGGLDSVEIYEFNITTGAITNPQVIELNIPYGVEFSPDDSKLYISSFNPSRLLQYDMATGNIYQIYYNSVYYYFGAIQTGPDDKLYVARLDGSYLGVINSPNELGANCDFVERGVSLGSRNGGLGLPNFVNYCAVADSNECTASSKSPICFGEQIRLFTGYYDRADYRWTGPGGFTSDIQNPRIDSATIINSGEYFVTITLPDGVVLRCSTTVEVLPQLRPEIIPNGQVEFCYGKSVILGLDQEYESIEWSTGDTTAQVTIDTTMFVTVSVVDSNGCIGYDSIAINTYIDFTPEIIPGGPVEFCRGDSVTLSLDGEYESIEWSTGDTTEQTTVKRSMLVRVSVVDSSGCKGFGVINVVVLNAKPPLILADGPLEFCFGNSVTLSLEKKYESYEWSTGETTPEITVGTGGFFSVSVVDSRGCEGNATIEVLIVDSLSFDIAIIEGEPEFCQGESVVLGTRKKYKEYSWSTGETTEQITVRDSMIVTLIVTDEDGCKGEANIAISVRDTIIAVIIGEPGFCVGDSVVLAVAGSYVDYLWSTGETTDTIIVKDRGTYYVTVTGENGCKGTTGFNVTISPNPVPRIKGPNPACLNAEVTYSVSNNNNYQTDWTLANGGGIIGNSVQDSVIIRWTIIGTWELIVQQTNEYGCEGYDTLQVEVVLPFTFDIISDDGLLLCPGGSLKLSAPEGYVRYLWSTDETTREIEIIEAREYSVIITDENGCIGIDTVEVMEGDLIDVSIIGDPEICPGGSINLEADKDYASYNWSTGETTKRVTITSPGNYTLIVTNEEGCLGEATVEVALIAAELQFADENPIDFGKVLLGGNPTIMLAITNTSEYDMEFAPNIKSDNGQIYTVPASNNIAANSTASIPLTFTPDYPQYYNDTLIIEVAEPCEFTLTKAITGAGYTTSTVWLPDVTAIPGTKDYCIPLRAVITNKYISDLNLTYSTVIINTDASLILPKNQYSVDDMDMKIELPGGNHRLRNDTSIVGNICGWILFAAEDKTPLILTDFAWNNPLVEVEKIDGSVIMERVCTYDIRRVQGFTLTEMQISPNPADQSIKINIESGEVGTFELSIYSTEGVEIKNYTWHRTKSSPETKEINVGLTAISSGIYRIMLRSPMEIISSPLGVVK